MAGNGICRPRIPCWGENMNKYPRNVRVTERSTSSSGRAAQSVCLSAARASKMSTAVSHGCIDPTPRLGLSSTTTTRHHAATLHPRGGTSGVAAAAAATGGATPPEAGAQQLVDLLAPLPLLWPVMLAVSSVSVLLAMPAAATTLPTHCLVVLLAPSLCMHVGVAAADILLGPQTTWGLRPPSAPPTTWSTRALPTYTAWAHIAASTLAYQAAATVAKAATTASAAAAAGTHVPTFPAAVWLLALATGACGGVGLAAAHELIHSRHPAHMAAANALLVWVCNWQYSRSHHHHHLTYCTPEDPTWARRGVGLWGYLPGYVQGGWRVAWREAAAECRRRGRRVWGPGNMCLVAVAAQVAVVAAVAAVWGPAGAVVHLVAAVVSQFYLAIIDYIHHYGLEREKLPSGRWGPPSAHSSFNSAHAVENAVLFKVLLHSDHHTAPVKPFGDLGMRASAPPAIDSQASSSKARFAMEAEPQLMPGPLPLALATALVLVPPLWFRVADPLVDAANAAHRVAVSGDANKDNGAAG